MSTAIVLNRALEAVRHLSDPSPPWNEILQCSRQIVGGDSASFILLDGSGELLTVQQYNVSESALTEYADHFHAGDVVTEMALGTTEGTWLDTNEFFPRSAFVNSSYYVDFMCKHRMRQMLSFVVEESASRRGALSIQRDVPVDRARQHLESEPVRQFSTALQAAIRSRRSESQRWLDAADAAFLLLGEASCLATPAGAIIGITGPSRQLMHARASLTQRDGRLWHPNPAVRESLRSALARAARGDASRNIMIPGPHGVPSHADFVRADERLGMGAEVLVFVRIRFDDAVKNAASGALRVAYGLTEAEERLLFALVAGQSPGAFAEKRGVSINTVRKQISTLMEKMDCHRQAELVTKALSSR